MFGTSKLCCQAGTPKMLSVVSCLHLFAKSTLSFQHRSVFFPGTAWSEGQYQCQIANSLSPVSMQGQNKAKSQQT